MQNSRKAPLLGQAQREANEAKPKALEAQSDAASPEVDEDPEPSPESESCKMPELLIFFSLLTN